MVYPFHGDLLLVMLYTISEVGFGHQEISDLVQRWAATALPARSWKVQT